MFSGNVANLPRSKSEKERQENIKVASHLDNELNNPCIKEKNLVNKCMDEMGYDREKCNPVFANYKRCRQFWHKVEKQRRKHNIEPYLPRPEEREKIKEEFLKKL